MLLSLIHIWVRVPSSAPDMVDIAQLVRAPDCGSGGRRFESDYPPHIKEKGFLPFFHICLNMGALFWQEYIWILGCRQVVRQRTLTPSSRWSESSQPSHVGASFVSVSYTHLEAGDSPSGGRSDLYAACGAD